ncbi:hypothetical protein C3941_08005 [Kaistia algarum]|uniref:glycoside hydrolase domain-containing protein n=1 Tax=Kaistia algarum TaxID=2083279 RepID=UPI000CE92602|nr:glycoside hydrolase domain-containing protein [Kaistia algarum]MCX5512000.1 DUF1906 domain-containing protein [Kaistia algarum]PPE80128.1 hypothetical protein C3941_08005 [Kaistia algarum]
MTSIIDASQNCGAKATALAASGIRTVFRYYSRDTVSSSKRLTRVEAGQLVSAGLRIGVVHEARFGNRAEAFDAASGLADGQYARTYGASTIGQPGGSTIYFGVDFDASASEIRQRILPFFRGVADALCRRTGEPDYVVGVYGSGATCAAVLDAGLAQRAWLSQSTGWRGHAAFLASGRWTLDQAMPDSIAGVDCDPDRAADGHEVGDFVVLSLASTDRANPPALHVNARSGLRLRAGPGVEFDSARTLAIGTTVFPLRQVGGWTQVDLEGDGVADGFVSSAFLIERATTGATSGLAVAVPHIHAAGIVDAANVPELIRQGSTADGLKAARKAAAASLPGYPTNGCAVHLSALLHQAGIDVPMIWGAGKLAQVLKDRGWSQIAVGKQIPGDVGVCFDNDPTPAGADHVYLVVGTTGPDEMMIADNQRTTDAPHARFATGHGKTPTEYFLRAL